MRWKSGMIKPLIIKRRLLVSKLTSVIRRCKVINSRLFTSLAVQKANRSYFSKDESRHLNSYLHYTIVNLTSRTEYTMAHAFFLLMGGVHIYDERGIPIGPLNVEDAIHLLRRGSIVLPPLQTIQGLNKSSIRGKLTAVAGLMWFVIPCLARFEQRLQMAPFEIMALAHTTIAIFTFLPWWHKPMNVDCPVRMSVCAFRRRHRADISLARSQSFCGQPSKAQIAYAYIFGSQDVLFDFNKVIYAPMFWAGDPDSVFKVPMSGTYATKAKTSAYVYGAASSLVVAIIFGAIHCIGWNYDLPSYVEQVLWRTGAVLVSGSAVAVICAYLACIFPLRANKPRVPGIIMTYVSIPCVFLYAVGRLLLIAVACSTFRKLSPGVFVQGSLRFVPL